MTLPNNKAVFDVKLDKEFTIELYLADYLINSLLSVMYNYGLLEIALPMAGLDTNKLQVLLLAYGRLYPYGWEKDMPCQVVARVINKAPTLKMT